MAEENKSAAKPKKEKPPALEDKPFQEFVEQHYIPTLQDALKAEGITDAELVFSQDHIDVPGVETGEPCWQVTGKWSDRQFCLYFLEEDIKGPKAFSCAAGQGERPSTLESFMIDERKITLDLLVLYTVQRLNGQKWLLRN